ncbi:MAG: hypothetical protein ABSD49_04640 [Candidatus Bathyarchaeia archaeon]|jgi:metal-responsive CopG/Arc/MetJ family transcriptional regulator
MAHEEKIPIGLNLPKTILAAIDADRGRINRSTYVTILLEKELLKRRKSNVA